MRKLKLEELNRTSVKLFKEQEKFPIVVILDNVRSALNVGAFFRTCDAFAIEKLILLGITAQPPHKEINKTAIGATASVNWEHHDKGQDLISDLKSNGYKVYGIEQTDQSELLQKQDFSNQKLALIFGNEVDGISDEILELLDVSLEIPQFGTKHSLNVSVCGGMVIWDVVKSMI